MIARLWWLCLLLPSLDAQPLEQEDILRLAHIKRSIRQHLESMPNYTCFQTVERYQRLPNAHRESLVDVLRLEVAYVSGHEMFAWPGSAAFQASELRELVTTGAFSNGAFVLHARAIFLGDSTTFEFAGKETIDNVSNWRFNYTVPQFRSGYQIRNPSIGRHAEVAYHGAIWAREDSLDLTRITIEAEDIPREILVEQAADQLDYQLTTIAGRQALLPLHSEVRLMDSHGRLAINRTRLSRCRQYSGESTLKFDSIEDEASAAAAAKRELIFDPGTELELSLDQELNHDDFAVGDVIQATLKRDIKDGKRVIAPKGSIARGRILRLEHDISGDSAYNITLRFDELLGTDWRAPLNLRFVRTDPPLGPDASARSAYRRAAGTRIPQSDLNGFVVFGDRLRLPRGFTTIWQTQK